MIPEIGDWEVVPVLQRYNTSAVMFGLPEANPGKIPGFRGSVWGVGQMMSPVPESSPELYWSQGILHTSEMSDPKTNARTVHGYEGADALRELIGPINRSRIHVLHMELASEQDYFKPDFAKTSTTPSLAYAYAHPGSPKAPAEARLSADEVNAAYAKEDAALKWLAADYFPANTGSRFVSSSDLKRMALPSTGYSISVAALNTALSDMLSKWGNDTYPPNYLFADGHYLSLAETFQVMADALAELDHTGKLPQTVKVARIYGPVTMVQGHGPNVGDVSVSSIAKKCSEIDPRLHDDSADPIPMNTVPAGVEVDGIAMNSAQFLRLMAQAMVNPSPETRLRVRMTYMYSAVVQAFPKVRPLEDTGAIWTFKPAPLEAP